MNAPVNFPRQAHYAFFRLGLVTGLVQPREVIAWADARLLDAEAAPDYDLVELSLAGRMSLSQLAGLLNQLQGAHVNYPAALELLFERARERLEADPQAAAELVYDLKLLLAEYHLPQATRAALTHLEVGGLGAFLAQASGRQRMTITAAQMILYVQDQQASAAFYARVLGLPPRLDVPGMTEFALGEGAVLGIMPITGIARLLDVPAPERAGQRLHAELYLLVADVAECHARAIQAGARELSAPAPRDWGHLAAYSLDPDGYVLAFASALQAE